MQLQNQTILEYPHQVEELVEDVTWEDELFI